MLTNIDEVLEELFCSPKYIREIEYRKENEENWVDLDLEDLPDDMRYDVIYNYLSSPVRMKIEGYVQEYLGYNSYVKYRNVGRARSVRELTSEDIAHLISVKGVVVSVTQPQSIINKLRYKCTSCSNEYILDQISDQVEYPTKCAGCEETKKTKLQIMTDKCDWDDYQVVSLQEDPESVEMGVTPRTIKIQIVGQHLVDICKPGDTVYINGLMSVRQRKNDRIFNWFIQAFNIDVDSFDVFNTELSDEDIMIIHNWSKHPDIENVIINSMFPSIYGHSSEKFGLALAMFGGIEKRNIDVRYRGSINVLLLGDPSTAKTAMINAASELAPKGIYTQAGGSTGVGLTAAAVKEEDQWVLAAGSVVLANNGICCIDELEKMSKADQDKLLECMEKQTVTVNKASIHATLPAKTSVLSAANPKYGRYRVDMSPADNIDLPAPLLARFDLIYVMQDIPEEAKDRAIAEKIVGSFMDDEVEGEHMTEEEIKKYVLYAKRIEPVFTRKALDELTDFYVMLRNSDRKADEQAIPITIRQFQGLMRLSAGFARMRLETQITTKHVKKAISLFMDALMRIGIDPFTGEMDSSIIESGKTQSSRSKDAFIMAKVFKHGVEITKDEAARMAVGSIFSEEEWNKKVRDLLRSGIIYEPSEGVYLRVTQDI